MALLSENLVRLSWIGGFHCGFLVTRTWHWVEVGAAKLLVGILDWGARFDVSFCSLPKCPTKIT